MDVQKIALDELQKIQKLLENNLSRKQAGHGRERGALTNLIKRIDDIYSDSFVIPDEWKRYCASGSSGTSVEFARKHGIEKQCDLRRAKQTAKGCVDRCHSGFYARRRMAAWPGRTL